MQSAVGVDVDRQQRGGLATPLIAAARRSRCRRWFDCERAPASGGSRVSGLSCGRSPDRATRRDRRSPIASDSGRPAARRNLRRKSLSNFSHPSPFSESRSRIGAIWSGIAPRPFAGSPRNQNLNDARHFRACLFSSRRVHICTLYERLSRHVPEQKSEIGWVAPTLDSTKVEKLQMKK